MNLSEPFIRRPVATTLLTIGLFVAAVLGLGLAISASALSSAMCRGVDCIDWTIEAHGRSYESRLADKCFYLGSPTGIGIFHQRRFGRAARSLLGLEYMLLGTEFLFIEPSLVSEPVIAIDANRYRVEFPVAAFCNRGETTVKLDAERERIAVEGCTSGVVQRIGREIECRADERGHVKGSESGGSPLR